MGKKAKTSIVVGFRLDFCGLSFTCIACLCDAEHEATKEAESKQQQANDKMCHITSYAHISLQSELQEDSSIHYRDAHFHFPHRPIIFFVQPVCRPVQTAAHEEKAANIRRALQIPLFYRRPMLLEASIGAHMQC